MGMIDVGGGALSVVARQLIALGREMGNLQHLINLLRGDMDRSGGDLTHRDIVAARAALFAARDALRDAGIALVSGASALRVYVETIGAGAAETGRGAGWVANTAGLAGADSRGWILGPFMADPALQSATQVKWGEHRAGQERPNGWAAGDEASSMAILSTGGPFTIVFADHAVTLERPGDFVTWGPGVGHTWRADGTAQVVTVRWAGQPSEHTNKEGQEHG